MCSLFTKIITTRFIETHLLFTSMYREIIFNKTYEDFGIHAPFSSLQILAWTQGSRCNVHAYHTHVLNYASN